MKNEIINAFPEELHEKIKNLFNGNAKLINKEAVLICETMNVDVDSLLIKLLPVAALYAKVPVSNYKVGAAVLCRSGNIYLGSNMEFTGEALSCSVHAEQSAIANAWLNGEDCITKLAVTAAPCGYCRQFLNELACSQELKVLLYNLSSSSHDTFLFSQLLPEAFGPKDLEINGGLMRAENHKLKLSETNDDELAAAALEAANKSYAPYTGNYSGVAVRLSDNSINIGRYAENAAYNPSMSPLQSALAFMNMNSKLGDENIIIDAVLVEADSVISQRDATETVLSSIGEIKLRYYKAVN